LSTASREARSTKSLGVHTLRGASARMRSRITDLRLSEALLMSEICSCFSDRYQARSSETRIHVSDNEGIWTAPFEASRRQNQHGFRALGPDSVIGRLAGVRFLFQQRRSRKHPSA